MMQREVRLTMKVPSLVLVHSSKRAAAAIISRSTASHVVEHNPRPNETRDVLRQRHPLFGSDANRVAMLFRPAADAFDQRLLSWCCSCWPCEKLRRHTSMPAAIISSRRSSDDEAGCLWSELRYMDMKGIGAKILSAIFCESIESCNQSCKLFSILDGTFSSFHRSFDARPEPEDLLYNRLDLFRYL